MDIQVKNLDHLGIVKEIEWITLVTLSIKTAKILAESIEDELASDG